MDLALFSGPLRMSHHELHELVDLRTQSELLLQKDFEFLGTFWNPDLCSFHANRDVEGRTSITSSSFCLFAILNDSKLVDRFSEEMEDGSFLAKGLGALFAKPWKSEDLEENNIYTTPIVLTAIYMMAKEARDSDAVSQVLNEVTNRNRIQQGVESVIENVGQSGSASFAVYSPSSYLTYWAFRALISAAEDENLPNELRESCRTALDSMRDWAESETHRQIAFRAAADAASFDATQLAYALSLYADASTATSRRLKQRVIQHAIATVFDDQLPDGLWPKSHPIFHYATRGNVYTFSFELVDVLLESRSLPPDVLTGFLPKLRHVVEWAQRNQYDEGPKMGWRSNHLVEGGPEAWSTAAVIIALRRIRDLASFQINELVLDELKATRMPSRDRSRLDEKRFYDADVPGTDPPSLKGVLRKYLIDPHIPGNDNTDRKYSAVLFGPPGTAKTTLAEAVASALGWPFVYLQTSDFSSEGVSRVTGKAREVFTRLGYLERAVILFDEVEEFVRNRGSEQNPESRLITTAMLSLIQELRGRKKVIFMVATNFLKNFDSAITRAGGRFDMLLLVAPPSKNEKKRMFQDFLAQSNIPDDRRDDLRTLFDSFVDAKYHEHVEYFAYSEWKAFVEAALRIGATQEPTDLHLSKLLDQHKSGIALCGQLREDYDSSKQMVRVF